MKTIKVIRIKKDAACCKGHFPGNPLVPGAFLVNLVTELCTQQYPHFWVSGIPKIKFTAPLRPEIDATIELEKTNDNLIKFKISSSEDAIASGKLQLTARTHLNET